VLRRLSCQRHIQLPTVDEKVHVCEENQYENKGSLEVLKLELR
jgi:hypothetical protein